MSDLTNIISVEFGSADTVYLSTPHFQYNSGIYLQFTDIDLPESYQVHFANSTTAETSLEVIGTSDGVQIPYDVWETTLPIYAWIYLHPTETSAVTKYEVVISKRRRAGLPDGTEPTEAEQTTIDTLITALNTAVEDAQTAQASAEASAEESATNVTHYPKIEDGTWWVWDADSSAWVDTEVTAEGTDGRGITSIELTSTVGLVDTYTITFTDGTTATFTVTNGADGNDYVLTDADKTEIASLISAPVDDVQIDGTSIVSDNVANIPLATSDNDGAMSAEQASHLDTVYADYSSALTALGVI